jgi:hypothetical protein
LQGIPKVRIMRATGAPLAVRLLRPASPALPPTVLLPGQPHAALLVVSWSNWCGPPPGPLRLRITLPAGAGTTTSPFDGPPDYNYVPACLGPRRPSTIAVIDAYVPGSAT